MDIHTPRWVVMECSAKTTTCDVSMRGQWFAPNPSQVWRAAPLVLECARRPEILTEM